jgi:uncharacterized membrane protein YhaH (DUF805 family)
MQFQEAIQSGFRNYVNFSGRAPRSEYWYWALFVLLVNIAAQLVDALILGNGFLELIVSLALLLPSLTVAARRLHDLNQSGWWLLIYVFVWGSFFWRGTDGPNRFGVEPIVPR